MAELTARELLELLDRTDLAILPVGSVEQHGPHLPCGADAIQATELARRVVTGLARHGVTAVAAPTIPFGLASNMLEYTTDFPGNLPVTADTLKALMKDIAQGLVRSGFRRLVLLPFHVENQAITQVAAREIAEQFDVQVLWIIAGPATAEAAARLFRTRGPAGHAGEGETSRLLAAQPELVRGDLIGESVVLGWEPAQHRGAVRRGEGIYAPAPGRVVPRGDLVLGSVGDPTGASAATGERLFKLQVDYICRTILRDLCASAGVEELVP
jgi:creatinine amidohydrolase